MATFRSSSNPHRGIVCLVLLALLSAPALGQKGDRRNDPQTENWKQFNLPVAAVLSPDEGLASLKVAPGFRVELFAAEPLVEDPVAIAWDERGRMYVVEMRAFMPNVDGGGELDPIGRVVVLLDEDRDGRADRHVVFVDGLVNPRAVAVVEGGILVGEPPHLWYCQDLDGDLRSDRSVSIASYASPDPDFLEHTENGLLFALDNWIYNAKSSRRFRFSLDAAGEPRIDVGRTLFRGQWGIAQDDRGRLYYNTNSSWLHGDLLPWELLSRNPNAGRTARQPAGAGERLIRDQGVHSIRVNVGINRGYQEHMLREDGRLARTTAVSAPEIYRGHQFPTEYRGDAFIPEPGANLVAHFRFDAEGVVLAGQEQLVADPGRLQHSFLCSDDERFRPVDCEVGPDGALYVIDMYRGILQHRQYVTSYLRSQILERQLDRPLGLGRIYRIVAADRPIDHADPRRHFEDGAALVRSLSHDNGWVRDNAQRLLLTRAGADEIQALHRLARRGESVAGRVHALWTLDGLGEIDDVSLAAALASRETDIILAALRIGAGRIGSNKRAFRQGALALAEDADLEVRTHLLLALAGFGADDQEARQAFRSILRRDVEVDHSRLAALSGLADREVDTLAWILEDPMWAEQSDGSRRWVSELVRSALWGDPRRLNVLLDLSMRNSQSGWRARIVVDTALEVARNKNFRAPALTRVEVLDPVRSARLKELQKRIAARPKQAAAVPLSAADRQRMATGGQLYQVCALCHTAQGVGQPGLAPPLVGSEWVLGSDERLVRIVLDGLTGPIEVAGEAFNLTMPGHRANAAFDDEAVAGLLTWLRRQWGHRGAPVEPETVARVRGKTASRRLPWTAAELEEAR